MPLLPRPAPMDPPEDLAHLGHLIRHQAVLEEFEVGQEAVGHLELRRSVDRDHHGVAGRDGHSRRKAAVEVAAGAAAAVPAAHRRPVELAVDDVLRRGQVHLVQGKLHAGGVGKLEEGAAQLHSPLVPLPRHDLGEHEVIGIGPDHPSQGQDQEQRRQGEGQPDRLETRMSSHSTGSLSETDPTRIQVTLWWRMACGEFTSVQDHGQGNCRDRDEVEQAADCRRS